MTLLRISAFVFLASAFVFLASASRLFGDVAPGLIG